MKSKTITKFFFGLVLFLGLTFPLPVTAIEGFRVRIDDLNYSKFPQADAYISVWDANGLPIKNPPQEAFLLTENRSPVSAEPFKTIQNKEQPLSIVLVMDTSGSMRGQGASAPMQKAIEAAEVKLGRKREENDIHLKGLKASCHHAMIRFEQGQCFIYSLNTANPVTINDVPVVQKRALARGDIIRLGETVLRFDS